MGAAVSEPATMMDLQEDMKDMKFGFKDLLFYKNGKIFMKMNGLLIK